MLFNTLSEYLPKIRLFLILKFRVAINEYTLGTVNVISHTYMK
jgi:hypothetical protein